MARRKTRMNAIDLYAWVREAGGFAAGARVSNIYSGGGSWILKAHTSRGKMYLRIRPGGYVYFSSVEPYEKDVDRLARFMRSRIRGGLLTGYEQMGLERILVIKITRGGETYHLVAELLPRGFLVVADKDMTILYADRFEEMRDRAIRPRIKYAPPPGSRNPIEEDAGKLAERLRAGRDLVRGLVKGWGLPGEVAEEILARTGLYDVKTASPETVGPGEIESLREALRLLLEEAGAGAGYLVSRGDEYIAYTPYKPVLYREIHGLDARRLDSFNEAVAIYYTWLERREAEERASERLRALRERLLASIREQERVVEENKRRVEELSRLIEILSNNYSLVEEILRCVREMRERHGWEAVTRCRGVEGYDKSRGLVAASIGGVDVFLDIRRGAWENIGALIKEKGVLERKIKRAEEKLGELRMRIEEIASREAEERARARRMVKPRSWYERYHWMITSEGFLVIGGRDAGQNEVIVRRLLDEKDVFMHADIHGAPAVVIKTRGRMPGERSLREAAALAAAYSRAWREGLGEVDVYWVPGSQVSKSAPSGEYLSKGAFMVYGRRNYIRHVRLSICIGVEEVRDELYGTYMRVITGPRELLEKRARAYVCIEPGDTGAGEAARRIHAILHKILGEEPGVSVKEIEERIPGSSRITGRGRGRGGDGG